MGFYFDPYIQKRNLKFKVLQMLIILKYENVVNARICLTRKCDINPPEDITLPC